MAMIKHDYPKDMATGFNVGDLEVCNCRISKTSLSLFRVDFYILLTLFSYFLINSVLIYFYVTFILKNWK